MIRIIYRTHNSTNYNNRPDWFHYRSCWENLVATKEDSELWVLYDGKLQGVEEWGYHANILEINSDEKLPELLKEWEEADLYYEDNDDAGNIYRKRVEAPDNEKAAGHLMYEFIYANIDNWDDNDIIYMVEDDYLHLSGWPTALQNVYDVYPSLNYVSLYDHPDKYSQRYVGLHSQIIISNYCHWRTVPSTCGTFAGRVKDFKQDKHIHFNLGDHNKFKLLEQANKSIVSAMPALATHCVDPWVSPFRNWKDL